jgi:hypothetical protein
MMTWFVGGLAAMVGLVVLANQLAKANTARLTKLVRWIGIGAAGLLGLYLLLRQAIPPGVITLLATGVLVWAQMRGRGAWSGWSQPPSGQTTDVETDWLRMTLDHDSGETDGVVLKGRYAGARLSEMVAPHLMELLVDIRVHDPEGAPLLEAYLRRVHPDAEEGAGDAGSGGRASDDVRRTGMSRAEALDVLGLSEGADETEIRAAHRRLMQSLHPDMGGNDYLAAKINEARDVLLSSSRA